MHQKNPGLNNFALVVGEFRFLFYWKVFLKSRLVCLWFLVGHVNHASNLLIPFFYDIDSEVAFKKKSCFRFEWAPASFGFYNILIGMGGFETTPCALLSEHGRGRGCSPLAIHVGACARGLSGSDSYTWWGICEKWQTVSAASDTNWLTCMTFVYIVYDIQSDELTGNANGVPQICTEGGTCICTYARS
jgi:hypothetical protein